MLGLLRRFTTWTLSSFRWGQSPHEALEKISDVTRVIIEWPDGETFSAREAIHRNPHLQNSQESLIQLVVHEFAERRARGDFIDL